MAIDIDEAKVEHNIFGLWLAWTLATAVGMLLGYLPMALLIGDVELGIARIIVPLLAGVLMGLAQWLVLRGYIIGSHNWIVNHAAGWVVGFTLGFFIIQALSQTPLGGLLGYLVFGVIVAVFQWPVLRREIPHIWSWILANVLGWTAGAYLSQLAAGVFFTSAPPSLIVSTLVLVGITGLIGGAITGIALIWIVRKPDYGYVR